MQYKSLISIMLIIPLLGLLFAELIIMFPLKKDSYFIESLVNVRLGKAECLVAGDSHPAAAFRNVLSGNECENLGTGGTSTWMVIDLVDSVSNSNNLKTAILSIGPHYFSAYRINNMSTEFKNIAEWFTPLPNLLSQNEAVVGFLIKWMKEKIQGTEKKKRSLITPEARLKQHSPIQGFRKSEIAEAYKAMVNNLIAKGVNVCIVRTPVTEDYSSKLGELYDELEWEKLTDELKYLGAKYYTYQDVFDEYPLDWYKNSEHLNEKGAEIYAPKIYQMCVGD